MSLSNNELYDQGVTKLKDIAREEGIVGFSKYRSNNKRDLVEIIIANRKKRGVVIAQNPSPPVAKQPDPVGGILQFQKSCMSYTIAELKQMAIDNNLQISGKLTKKAICEAYEKKKALTLGSPRSPIARPRSPIARPRSPIARPEYPIARPRSPIARPEYPIARPRSPIARPEYPIARPKAPIARPKAPIARPESLTTRPVLGKKCMSYLKQELQDIAIKHNISSSGTKSDLCSRILNIYDEPAPRSPARTPARTPGSPARTPGSPARTPTRCMDNKLIELRELALRRGIDARKMRKQDICDALEAVGGYDDSPKQYITLTREIVKNSYYRDLLLKVSREEVLRFARANGFNDQLHLPTDEILQNMWMVFNDEYVSDPLSVSPKPPAPRVVLKTPRLESPPGPAPRVVLKTPRPAPRVVLKTPRLESPKPPSSEKGPSSQAIILELQETKSEVQWLARESLKELEEKILSASPRDKLSLTEERDAVDDVAKYIINHIQLLENKVKVPQARPVKVPRERERKSPAAAVPVQVGDDDPEIRRIQAKVAALERELSSSAMSTIRLTKTEDKIRMYNRRIDSIRKARRSTMVAQAIIGTEGSRQAHPPPLKPLPIKLPPPIKLPLPHPLSPVGLKPMSPLIGQRPRSMTPEEEQEETRRAEVAAVEREKEIQKERMRKQRLTKPAREQTLNESSITDIESRLSEITTPAVLPPVSLGEIRNSIFRELGLTF